MHLQNGRVVKNFLKTAESSGIVCIMFKMTIMFSHKLVYLHIMLNL